MTTAQYPNSLRDRDTYMPDVVVVVAAPAAAAVVLGDPLRQCEFHTRTAMKCLRSGGHSSIMEVAILECNLQFD